MTKNLLGTCGSVILGYHAINFFFRCWYIGNIGINIVCHILLKNSYGGGSRKFFREGKIQ